MEGLDTEALQRPVLPTGWNCLGLVQHLTLDVEHLWFTRVMAGQISDGDSAGTSAWLVDPSTSPEVIYDRYRLEIEKANAVIAAMPLDAASRAGPDFFGEWRLPDLRAVLLHVITETACHAGHLDAARELLDGGTWLILE
jgi:hypothetical protein